ARCFIRSALGGSLTQPCQIAGLEGGEEGGDRALRSMEIGLPARPQGPQATPQGGEADAIIRLVIRISLREGGTAPASGSAPPRLGRGSLAAEKRGGRGAAGIAIHDDRTRRGTRGTPSRTTLSCARGTLTRCPSFIRLGRRSGRAGQREHLGGGGGP